MDEFRLHIEKDKAFARRFQPVLINEPSQVNDILRICMRKWVYNVLTDIRVPKLYRRMLSRYCWGCVKNMSHTISVDTVWKP